MIPNLEATCPICHSKLSEARADDDTPVYIGECPVCNTPYHLDCWNYSGGCGVFQCSGRGASLANVRELVSPEEIARIELKRQLSDVILTNSDRQIWTFWQEKRGLLSRRDDLTMEQQQRIRVAEERAPTIEQLFSAVSAEDKERTLCVYLGSRSMLEQSADVVPILNSVRTWLGEWLRHFNARYQEAACEDDDENLAELANRFDSLLEYTEVSREQRDRMELAKDRIELRQALETAIKTKEYQTLQELYDRRHKIINSSSSFLALEIPKALAEAERRNARRAFDHAIKENAIEKIVKAGDALILAGEAPSPSDYQWLKSSRRALVSLRAISSAIQSDDVFSVASMWECSQQLLRGCLSDEQRKYIKQALLDVETISRLRVALKESDLITAAQGFTELKHKNLLSAEEEAAGTEAAKQYGLFQQLTASIEQRDAQGIQRLLQEIDPKWVGLLSSSQRIAALQMADLAAVQKTLERAWALNDDQAFLAVWGQASITHPDIYQGFEEKATLVQRRAIMRQLDQYLEDSN